MTTTELNRTGGVEWSVVSRALPGQLVSGDLHVVAPWAGGVLAAVVDGLGHGDEATVAARAATGVLHEHPDEPVIALVQRCHQALRDTRGAVMTLVSFDHREQTVSAVGVGNVEAMLFRAADTSAATQAGSAHSAASVSSASASPVRRESVLLRGGVVGYQLPALQASVWPLRRGDTVVFATDGVRDDFADALNTDEPVTQIVDRVIGRSFRGTDDGLVLALRYVGAP